LDLEPQEVLLDKLAQEQEKKLGISEKKFEVPLPEDILRLVYFASLILFLTLFYRTFQLQMIQGEDLSALAQRNKFIIHQIKASRGVIYDKNLNQLVFNQPSFDLICHKNSLPQDSQERLTTIKEVAHILEEDPESLKNKIEESENPIIPISQNLSHQKLIVLETRIKELSGFEIENNTIRDYIEGETFAHLIGYTGKIRSSELQEEPEMYSITDYIGRDGIEKSYEYILRKNPGKLRIKRDALGNIISKEIIQFPEPGQNLVLWLDSELQGKIQESLEYKIREIGAKGGAVVALNPNTGGVMALVSLPSFDNNLFQKGANQEELQTLLEDPLNLNSLFNRVISGKYLTGSTIKPLIASAALEEEIISHKKIINCQGKIIVQDFWNPDKTWEYEDWQTHGWTDLKKAIAESCNVYFYTIGGGYKDQEGLGPTKIKEYLELFGWNEKAQIDLPGEVAGFIPDKEWKKTTWGKGWWDGDTYNLSIGQGFLGITPLEVANSFAVIANGGTLFQPQTVNRVVDGQKNTIQEIQPEIIRQNFINGKNLQIVREGMRQAVTGENSPHASAVILNSLPVAAAAKTGTAELGEDYYHNWVTVFAPYENPEIVLTVMIERVEGVQAAALPVAKEILEWYFTQP